MGRFDYEAPRCEGCADSAPCSHLRPGRAIRENSEVPCCDAFPFGVPTDIYCDGFDHRQPFPGDMGIRYSPDKNWDPSGRMSL
jgi:hypothetical protein